MDRLTLTRNRQAGEQHSSFAEFLTLLVQDANDKEVHPMNVDKLATAMPHAHVLRTSGLGHRRVLRDGGVVQAVVEHVGPAPDSQAALEQWLFERDRRTAVAR